MRRQALTAEGDVFLDITSTLSSAVDLSGPFRLFRWINFAHILAINFGVVSAPMRRFGGHTSTVSPDIQPEKIGCDAR
jgi:hypothetical protein